jgi:dihydrofolate reductase
MADPRDPIPTADGVGASRRFIAIVAMAENRVIGSGNKLPWHLPEDFQWFKQQTLGKVLLMGRKTFESIGRPLPRRTTVVLSRTAPPLAGASVIRSLAELPAAAGPVSEIWVCGGAEIYALTLPEWSEVFITRVKRLPEGDAFFPPFEDRFPPPAVVRETAEFTILHYRR